MSLDLVLPFGVGVGAASMPCHGAVGGAYGWAGTGPRVSGLKATGF